MSAELLFQNAEASFSAFFLSKIAGVENGLVELAKTAAQQQLEVAAAKVGPATVQHLVNAATCLLAIGDKAGASHALQRAGFHAPAHLKGHVKGALEAVHGKAPAAPKLSAPKPVDEKPAAKPAEAPKPAAPAAPAAPAKAEAPKPEESKPSETKTDVKL